MILCDYPQKVKNLFIDCHETMIHSYLQGCMGECYVDDFTNPRLAQILVADFCFFAGVLCVELIKNIKSEFVIMVPQNEKWSLLIESIYGQFVSRRERYATLKEHAFNQSYLQTIVFQLDKECELKMIDKEYYQKIMTSSYQPFRDLCGQFKTFDEYQKNGIGCVIVKDNKIISGASSYTYYLDGIEIEIDTHRDYQGKGFAKICGSKLILECLERNLYPSWDAQNKVSLALAQKLGYHFDRVYPVYELVKKEFM